MRGSCEINGAHCTRKPHFSCCTKCQHSLESKCLPLLAFNLENQHGSPSLHSVHWWTGWSGPDGLELGAQPDARVTVEKAVCYNHLSYNDCSMEALSCDNSLQFLVQISPICAHHASCQASMKMTLSRAHFCH